MRAVIQRVSRASVSVDDHQISAISHGYMILLGIHQNDTDAVLPKLASKIVGLRINDDDQGQMNRSILDTGGSILLISQFTLHADVAKGKRPSFRLAMRPPESEQIYEQMALALRNHGVSVSTGEFGAQMQVSLINDGPVTIILDTDQW